MVLSFLRPSFSVMACAFIQAAAWLPLGAADQPDVQLIPPVVADQPGQAPATGGGGAPVLDGEAAAAAADAALGSAATGLWQQFTPKHLQLQKEVQLWQLTLAKYDQGGDLMVQFGKAAPVALTADNAGKAFDPITTAKQARELCECLTYGILLTNEKDYQNLLQLYGDVGLQPPTPAGRALARDYAVTAEKQEDGSFKVAYAAIVMPRGMGAALQVGRFAWTIDAKGVITAEKPTLYLDGPLLNWQTVEAPQMDLATLARFRAEQALAEQRRNLLLNVAFTRYSPVLPPAAAAKYETPEIIFDPAADAQPAAHEKKSATPGGPALPPEKQQQAPTREAHAGETGEAPVAAPVPDSTAPQPLQTAADRPRVRIVDMADLPPGFTVDWPQGVEVDSQSDLPPDVQGWVITYNAASWTDGHAPRWIYWPETASENRQNEPESLAQPQHAQDAIDADPQVWEKQTTAPAPEVLVPTVIVWEQAKPQIEMPRPINDWENSQVMEWLWLGPADVPTPTPDNDDCPDDPLANDENLGNKLPQETIDAQYAQTAADDEF